MHVGQPSRTAMYTAQARAYHQIADQPRIFHDPFALRIVGESGHHLPELDQGFPPDLARRRRLWIAARSRYADDTLMTAIAAGTRQVVILGAGLDTTAYRISPKAPTVRFIEADHPATQEWKRHRLGEAGIDIPPTLTFATIDFEQPLTSALTEAGLDRTRGALYLWLGVTMYLTRTSIDATLRTIAGHGSNAQLIFDYFTPPHKNPTNLDAQQMNARADRVAALGEPWRTFLTDTEINEKLKNLSFRRIENYSATSLLTLYGVQNLTGSSAIEPHLVHASLATGRNGP
ncbi:class I SAM-dependent methyltransferase [Nocardia sp. NPDC004068]|uniref:class I SAM-dependent methyltransferase n=1 Tax=Nocardia sp. NPDC004068 TaxID=3364303 RepID=UPI00369DB47E